jgi:putative DNA methylase
VPISGPRPRKGVDKSVNGLYDAGMNFGKFIREERKRRGLSLRAIAQRTGVNAAYLSRVEVGKVAPSDQLIRRLSNVLSYNEDELLLLAGRLPAELRTMIEKEPRKVTSALRRLGELAVAESSVTYSAPVLAARGETPIEDGFPFEEISDVAEIESWRKEVYRPVYHIHKWWAQRLGTVFRAAILGAAVPKGSSIMEMFYQPVRLPGLVVFDPFMGSGTTVGEAQKLGCTVIGRDINPVAYRSVRAALGPMDRRELEQLFGRLQKEVGRAILSLYKSHDSKGNRCDVLYYFWVKVLPCPSCGETVDLFSKYVFASHASAAQDSTVHVVCPECGGISSTTRDARHVRCAECKVTFNVEAGSAGRTNAVCRRCRESFPIARTARAAGSPPGHRMYAKLVLRRDGTKEYLRITKEDVSTYRAACDRLHALNPLLPRVPIQDGHNTRQILNYGYRYWHELFNERQLLALSMLGQAIRDLPDCPERGVLGTLFSGVLEFNNMFASYKGEGTGAVRHMFSHHILKPERTPIEANLWGTPKSSGAFSTLFQSRLLRALDYRESPFEVAVADGPRRNKGRKVFGISPPIGGEIITRYPRGGLPMGATYLSCGDSSKTGLPEKCVNLVVTDPPFFDNVHYSELADFFHVWQQLYFGDGKGQAPASTRSEAEVQDIDASAFAEKLRRVFSECHRVLRDDGLLVFSYHHSRDDGWSSLAGAVVGAGFSFVQAQPVKSEMSVAAPKSQAKEPIDLDVLLVCRKHKSDWRKKQSDNIAWKAAKQRASEKVRRFNGVGRRLSRNDVRVVFMSQVLVELSAGRDCEETLTNLMPMVLRAQDVIESLWSTQDVTPRDKKPAPNAYGQRQLAMFSEAVV